MGIFKDKNLYSILNGSYNSIFNKYIVKDENLKSNLVTSGATVIGNNVENLLEQESLLKEMHSNNEIEKLLPMLIDYPQHFVTSFLSFIKEICDWSPLIQRKRIMMKIIVNIFQYFYLAPCFLSKLRLPIKFIMIIIIIKIY